MLKFFLMSLTCMVMSGCSYFADPDIIVRANAEKRKSKPEYMHSEEKPIESHIHKEKLPPIAPQVGIRIPFGK